MIKFSGSNIPDHSLRRDTLSFNANVIGDVCVGRPDGSDHDCHTLCTRRSLNTKPEHGEDGSRDDTEVGEVVSKTSSDGDGEGNMKFSTNGSVQNHRDSNTGSTDDDLIESADGRWVVGC